MDVSDLRQRLDTAGQGHLLQFWDSLNDSEKQSLYSELSNINFEEINRYFEVSMESLKHVAE